MPIMIRMLTKASDGESHLVMVAAVFRLLATQVGALASSIG